MEQEKLKIVEMKKTRKEVNKALLGKTFDAALAVVAAWATCYEVHDFAQNGTLAAIPIALLMLNNFAFFLKRARTNNDIIDENLDKELDLEELVEYNGLQK